MPPFRAQTGEGGFTGVDIMVCPHEETLFSTEDAEEGAGEEGMARGAGPELRGVQDCAGTLAGERTDAKFGAKFGAGRSFADRACFFAALR